MKNAPAAENSDNDPRHAVFDKTYSIENVFESITDNFIALDKDFNFIYANQEALKLYGMQKEDVMGKNLWDILPGGRQLKFFPELHKALDEQVPVHFEEFSPAVGKWILANAYPTGNGLAVYFRDITEQKKMEAALRDSEYNLRALINNTADFIWSIDTNYNIIQVNQPFVDFVYSFTKKVLRPGDSIMMDDFGTAIRDKWSHYYERVLAGQTFIVVDEEVINNTRHNREKRFKPIFSQTGEVIGISCYARDISEETRLHTRILNEEKKLKAIINNTTDIIWLVNDHMETIYANQAYIDRVTYLTNNKNFEELTENDFDAQRVEQWHNYYRRALNGETFTVVIEDEIRGKKVFEEVRFNPIHDGENKVVSVNCMSRDITAEKEHMIRVQRQNEQLNEIAWIQSHQVRGPVATILGLAQLFNIQDVTDPSNLTVLAGIKEAAGDLDGIIKDVVAKTNAAKL